MAMPNESVSDNVAPDREPPVLRFTPMVEMEHLLRVIHSVTGDANKTWADIWGEVKRLTTPSGAVLPEAKEGFVPACGWPEFLEKLWLLKHYLDYVQRLCESKR